MLKIGITGQSGFIGQHLYNTLGLFQEKFTRIPFEKEFFSDEGSLDKFVSQCDVIVHLAGMNRSNDPALIYSTNIALARQLAAAADRTNKRPYIIFASSSQEEFDNLYGNSKREARKLLSDWAKSVNVQFCGLIIPNVFGPFCKPFYNSAVATFCYQLLHGEIPEIQVDKELKLIYVSELIDQIMHLIQQPVSDDYFVVPHTSQMRVSDVLIFLKEYEISYLQSGIIPELRDSFHLNLFNTFRSYLPLENTFPVIFAKHIDQRGVFSEIIRLGNGMGGQVSFSTTLPGSTRGNHFHTRKIERFAVIKGNALIQLRQVGTREILNFYLSGHEPSYVDMPIWTIHNIKNIGQDDLITIFWINEKYNESDPDTFFEQV